MERIFRPVLACVAVLGLSLAAGSASWAGDEAAKAEGAMEAVKVDAEKAAKAVEKKAEEKVDEVTYKKGEKPGDIYKNTESPPVVVEPATPPAAKPADPPASK